jgi:hypothetical protein
VHPLDRELVEDVPADAPVGVFLYRGVKEGA